MIWSSAKNRIGQFLKFSMFRTCTEFLAGDFPKIFVCHRFSTEHENIPHRLRQDHFSWCLDQLNRGYNVMTLGDCVAHFKDTNKWPKRAVVLTVDDGYADFYKYGFPELKKRNLGATFFVTYDFVAGKCWLWPDIIEYALLKADGSGFNCPYREHAVYYPLGTESDRLSLVFQLVNYCKGLANTERLSFIDRLMLALGVDIPAIPPKEYQSVTWSQLQEMQEHGIEIGAHTISHPILSKLDDSELEYELIESGHLLSQKLGREVRSCCYPNSAEGDIDDRVLALMDQSNYLSAVFGTNLNRWDMKRLPRMGLDNDPIDFLWKLAGLENFKFRRNRLAKDIVNHR